MQKDNQGVIPRNEKTQIWKTGNPTLEGRQTTRQLGSRPGEQAIQIGMVVGGFHDGCLQWGGNGIDRSLIAFNHTDCSITKDLEVLLEI